MANSLNKFNVVVKNLKMGRKKNLINKEKKFPSIDSFLKLNLIIIRDIILNK